jgi:hypothetical protein
VGTYEIRLIVVDAEGNSDTLSLPLSIVTEINDAPQIIDIQKSIAYLAPGETLDIACLATDANNDPLTYQWTGNGGSFSGTGSMVQWTAPAAEGIFQLSVGVADDEGLTAQRTTTILVKNFDNTGGNLVADYPFTGNANDVTGHLLHGTANGAILTTDQFGVQQRAYYFNGGAQHIRVENAPLLNFQAGMTVSCWFKANALPEKETFLLSHGSWQNRWKISITPEKKVRLTVNTLTAISDLDLDVPVQTDSFYQLTATYDGALLALYLNGVLHTYKNLSGDIRTTTFPLLMGQMLPGQPEYNFKGVMDAVRIYDYALTPQAIQMQYQQAITSTSAPTVSEVSRLVIFPNPASDVVHVHLLPGEKCSLQVFNLNGKKMVERSGLSGDLARLEVSGYPAGGYVVVYYSEKGFRTGYFVK